MSEFKLLQELERELLGLLDLGQGLSDGLVVLAFVVDGVRHDEAKVELRLGRVSRRGSFGTLEHNFTTG